MSDVHNHEHAKENKGVGPASSLRTVIGVIVSIIAVCLVMFAIFRVYSNELSDEFYDLASVSMDDYTAAQKVEVESFISEVSSVISTMCVLAESPDIDPSGSTFAAYLEEWNQQGSFQVTYTPIEELEQGVASNRNERDEETLRHLYAGETVVSDVRKSNRLNGYYFSIAKPVNRDGLGYAEVVAVQAVRLAQHRESGEASGYEPGELAGYAARHAADQRGRNRRSRVEGIRRL